MATTFHAGRSHHIIPRRTASCRSVISIRSRRRLQPSPFRCSSGPRDPRLAPSVRLDVASAARLLLNSVRATLDDDDFELSWLSWPLTSCFAWVTPVESAECAETPADARSSAGSSHHAKRPLLLTAQGAHQERAKAIQSANSGWDAASNGVCRDLRASRLTGLLSGMCVPIPGRMDIKPQWEPGPDTRQARGVLLSD